MEPVTRSKFDAFLKQNPGVQTGTDNETLFKQFQAWEATQNAKAQTAPARPAAQR